MGAIKSFGDFWSREDVEWHPGHGGRRELLGYRKRPKFVKVDFRQQIGIYVLFTASREVVYVGQVGSGKSEKANLYGRLRRHTINRLRGRWTHFSWFGVRAINSDSGELEPYKPASSETAGDVLNELEGILIHLMEPRLNRQGGALGRRARISSGAERWQGDDHSQGR